jgi:hypothetical protein
MNHVVKLFAAISISCLTFAVPALALEDTPENRAAQADNICGLFPLKA